MTVPQPPLRDGNGPPTVEIAVEQAALMILEVLNGIRMFKSQGGLGRPKGMNQAGGMSMR